MILLPPEILWNQKLPTISNTFPRGLGPWPPLPPLVSSQMNLFSCPTLPKRRQNRSQCTGKKHSSAKKPKHWMRDSVWGKSPLDIKEISEIELLTLIVVLNSCVVYINLVNRGPISWGGVFTFGYYCIIFNNCTLEQRCWHLQVVNSKWLLQELA